MSAVFLSWALNKLSGQIPSELGLLTKLGEFLFQTK